VSSAKAEKRPSLLGYLPALDGVRALAVGAVIVYHANKSWLGGGFLSGGGGCALACRCNCRHGLGNLDRLAGHAPPLAEKSDRRIRTNRNAAR
jgi:hypothetical protein